MITGGSGLTTGIFSDVPPLSGDPVLAGDVLQLLVAAGMTTRESCIFAELYFFRIIYCFIIIFLFALYGSGFRQNI